MSGTIDQRIVSMKFDNKQFESGVDTSMKTLSKLEKSLNLPNSAKGLNDISEAARKVSFDGMSNGIEAVKVKFSALQVMAITTLANITNSAVNAGKRLVSSLTIDPIMDGFREYETQMNSIQTIMANTSSKGTTMKEVKDALQELNTYSDKTIYNFTEMTRNIGTFTAAGVDLKTSTAAIKGIANLAAVSGSNSQQASTAMYQLSQALASGTVKLQDWNSVVNAGMGGSVFQNALKETAKVHGIAIDDMIKDEGSFRETLQKGWLTSSILTETLSKFTGDLNEKQLKSMGYTDAQIKEIIKMGKMANDAATKVKTFTQLMDTLKEAVGSGWAQTWQTVFGDFEEAKVMFTDVSNTLGAMIESSSKARNDMLTGWKDLGGRVALIDSIKNAFNGVMDVVKSVSGAFRDIFPPITSKQLYDFTVGLKTLTEHMRLSESTSNKLRSTFKGVFAIFDIGKTILSAVGNAIGIIIGGTGNLASSVLTVTSYFGEWIAALDKTIKQSDIFNKVLSTLAYGIRNGFEGVSFIFDTILKSVGSVITVFNNKINIPGFEALHSFLGLLGKRMTSIGREANNMSTTVAGAFAHMNKSITNSKIGALFSSIYDTIKKVANAVGILVNRMVDSITKSFQNADFSAMLDAIAGISIGGMLLAFKKFMGSLSDTIDNYKGLFSNAKGILDSVRGSLEAYQQNLKAGVLLKIATAISLLSASIVAISLIDSGKLVSSLTAIGTLFGQLLLAMKLYSTIGEFKGKVIKASIVMMTMSTSILILSGAMKNIASLDWNGIAKGAVGITTLAGILVASAKILSTGNKAIIKGSSGMIIFAVALKILSSSCKDLSKLNWDGLAKGLVGVGALMTEISLFLNTAKFSSKSITTAIGIIILSGAIKILASACSDFGNLSWSNVSKGLVSIGALLTEISIFVNKTSSAKNIISISIGLIALATAMKILASAMNDFGSMSWESIAKGLTAMAGALTEITIATRMLPKDLPITATGLVIVGAALNIISSALIKMGGMSWESIAKGMVTLGGSLTILVIALRSMKGTIAGSTALLIASGALAILAPALSLLGAMSWNSIVKGLVDLAGTIAIFGASAAILTPIIPSMLSLSASLVLLGISMVGIGAGLALVGVGLSGVATGFTLLAGTSAAGATAIVTALGIIITGVAALVPAIMGKIGEGIIAFCKVITDGMPAIINCVSTILKSIIDCIVTNTPLIINGVFKILTSILESLVKWVPTIIQKVIDLMIALLKVIADNVPKFVTAAVDIIVAFVKGISDNLPRIIDIAFKLIITFINGLADAIRNNSEAIANACYNLVTAVVDGIGSLVGKFVEAGAYAVKGFIKGLLSLPGKIWDAGKEIGNKALESAKKALDEHSPSKAFFKVGSYATEGFVNGLSSLYDVVSNTGTKIGNNAITSVSSAISGISDLFDDNIDSQPVIRPVLDMTDIQNGSNQLYSMMSGLDNYNLNGSINAVNSTAGQIRNKQLLDDAISDTKNNANTTNVSSTTKQPITLQLMLQNGKAIAEYIVDDMDSLMGTKNKITARCIGV